MPGPSFSDYDEKLREMGNYLWDLDQEADQAHRADDATQVAHIEGRIEHVANRAAEFRNVPGPHGVLAALVEGLALRMLRRWDLAARVFLDVLDENPLNGEAWLELTWCLSEMGNWEDAEQAARKGIEFFPEVSAAWGNLAQVLIHLGRPTEAEPVVSKALELDENDPRNHELMARLAHG